ncbi:hypothetical protein D0861_01744 [Hortaea werneckii]|uniref:Uncharacterized protein n=1 Tax=Hortaea werneckii TaxID=91943 RepID=A0A3M7FXZ3_HORWE|nr:hypothetical protein D0861_01744 [Hortaea werneckii]
MLSPKSKAEQDAFIATGLLPVSCAVDYLATLVWLFGGLLETDAVWAYRTIGQLPCSSLSRAETQPVALHCRCAHRDRNPRSHRVVTLPDRLGEELGRRCMGGEQSKRRLGVGDGKGCEGMGKGCHAFEKEPEKALRK